MHVCVARLQERASRSDESNRIQHRGHVNGEGLARESVSYLALRGREYVSYIVPPQTLFNHEEINAQ